MASSPTMPGAAMLPEFACHSKLMRDHREACQQIVKSQSKAAAGEEPLFIPPRTQVFVMDTAPEVGLYYVRVTATCRSRTCRLPLGMIMKRAPRLKPGLTV